MLGPDGVAVIQGDTGFVTAAAGAKVGIINRWNIRRSGTNPDGKPRLRFKCQFSWVNDVLMGMKIQKRVVVQMRTKLGLENVDILAWDDWRYDGGILYLDNVVHVEGVVQK
jgi:hypothetical protein